MRPPEFQRQLPRSAIAAARLRWQQYNNVLLRSTSETAQLTRDRNGRIAIITVDDYRCNQLSIVKYNGMVEGSGNCFPLVSILARRHSRFAGVKLFIQGMIVQIRSPFVTKPMHQDRATTDGTYSFPKYCSMLSPQVRACTTIPSQEVPVFVGAVAVQEQTQKEKYGICCHRLEFHGIAARSFLRREWDQAQNQHHHQSGAQIATHPKVIGNTF